MKIIRRVLYPFSLLYNVITWGRNFLYNVGLLKATKFSVPIIAVGNLSVGGTGKTPQIEYLIRLLTNKNYKLATVSRGYKRKTTGMLVANASHTADDLGDEPFQFYSKFKNISVVVNANRVEALNYLAAQKLKPDVVLLDDAMQHRKVAAGFYIMLSAYNDFFYNDLVLPAGNLRENRCGAKRADCIVITKCPNNLSETEAIIIKNKIRKYAPNVPVYFTEITYDAYIYNQSSSKLISALDSNYILLAGIAKPEPFFNKLKKKDILTLEFSDHHNFTDQDIAEITQKAAGKLIVTTEKDYVRLINKLPETQLFYLPIQATFLFDDEKVFNKQIMNYITTSV